MRMKYQADIELLDQHSAGLFTTNLANSQEQNFFWLFMLSYFFVFQFTPAFGVYD